ncbi:MAG: invasin domain 3-containing protein [Candidatus Micrarchaeia archaeon]
MKGQSASELLVVFMFVMLVFTLFLTTFVQQRSLEMQQAKVSLADSVGEQFAYEINLAARSGNGYSRKFTYPVKLEGVTPYNITLNNLSKSIDIFFTLGTINYSHSFPLIHTNVRVEPQIIARLPNGTPYGYVLHSSNLTFSRGEMYIQNVNNIIFISTVTYLQVTPQTIQLNASPTEIGIWMNTSNITAVVLDQFGNHVPDGTLVRFETDLGMIDSFVPTKNGTAVAVLRSGFTPGRARVYAKVSGVNKSIVVTFVG